ncbi:carboxylesterase type B [Polyplosphaeria fusca]|uniref:Carboxylic ester hydrolase n=1 Tax=Polyplosphaeria fusca TaxID=682080 RepID=A0A9P4QQW2_9PLEO|nr:carboxylesterase type B [Polyplosphaeria fusca]
MKSRTLVVVAACLQAISASPFAASFDAVKRQAAAHTNSTAQIVDLGYELYQGVANATTGLNVWKGIRFAAPPTGSLRWQAPQPPIVNRSSVIPATSFHSMCPQSPPSGILPTPFVAVDEDCLFLNVYAPANASTAKLPVLVWIHGGGYGLGDGTLDMTEFINANDDGIVGVAIQYRLGAFGFLSSDEVAANGVANAGILDQTFALQWVQSYIELFGGDPTKVTISGNSAGAGSVMLQDIAYGGTLGTSLFRGSISSSPYLPTQYGYKDFMPSQAYYAFASEAGCFAGRPYGNKSQTIFECLISADSETLQRASASVSSSTVFGTWAFVPVTDGTFIQETPSQALIRRKVNGLYHLSGNNADEGGPFVPPTISNISDLISWLHTLLPMLRTEDIAKVLYYYPTPNTTLSNANDTLPEFDTPGDEGPYTALNVSSVASGQQQRANNLYAETTFVCPSYWLAEAYNGAAASGSAGYKYQYSVPFAVHGIDTYAAFGPVMPNVGPDFALAFRRIWGNFVRTGDPSISAEVAAGAASNGTGAPGWGAWPPFTLYEPRMANLNQTGGVLYVDERVGVPAYKEPGLRNKLRFVDGYQWEGGRGVRCDFWKSVWRLVPE